MTLMMKAGAKFRLRAWGKAVYQIPKSMKTGRRSPGTAARCCCISGLFEYLVLNVAVNRSCIYNDVICLLSTC